VKLKQSLPFLLAFVLPLVLIYAWWGGFNPVLIATGVRGSYTYAYLEHVGDYAKLTDLLGEVRRNLEGQGVQPGHAISVLYSNPDVVPRTERKARVGFLVDPDVTINPPLQVDTIPAREVLYAQVRASALLAPSRAYQALDEHLQAQNAGIRMPTVEIYQPSGSVFHMGVLTVEMDLP